MGGENVVQSDFSVSTARLRKLQPVNKGRGGGEEVGNWQGLKKGS